jgi:hypothetical protein
MCGAEKTKPPVGRPTGGLENSGGDPFKVGAVWVSGAPVAKPIPKIKADRSANVIRPRSRHRAQGADRWKLREGVEHGLSPIDAPSLLEAGARFQSENAIDGRPRFLSLECRRLYDTLWVLPTH